jgi:hypothetical protein
MPELRYLKSLFSVFGCPHGITSLSQKGIHQEQLLGLIVDNQDRLDPMSILRL